MSLTRVYRDAFWVKAALECQPEDILDLTDQLSVVRETRETIANKIQSHLTPVVLKRLMDGEMAPQLAEKYFETIPGFTQIDVNN